MTWAPIGFRGQARHAPAFDKRGATFLVPPLQLCTSREGRIETVFPERVDCKRCLAKLATIPPPADREARMAWFAKHGVR